MGRKAKIDDYTLLNLLDRFFIEICCNDISMLKIPAFAEFVRKNGYEDVQDYIIRRNVPVRTHINELKNSADEVYKKQAVVFRNLDVESFLSKNTSPAALKKALVKRDSYYRQISESARYCIGKYNDLDTQISSLTNEINVLKQANDSLTDQNISLNERLQEQQEEIKKLRIFIDTYINPEIANELLLQTGLLKTTSGIVSSEAVENHLIKADTEIPLKNNIIRNLFDKM